MASAGGARELSSQWVNTARGALVRSTSGRYSMTTRAASAAQTRERMLGAAFRLMDSHPYDEVTLQLIAQEAGDGISTVRIYNLPPPSLPFWTATLPLRQFGRRFRGLVANELQRTGS